MIPARRLDFTPLLAALRASPAGVTIGHEEDADKEDVLDVTGYQIDLEPDGHFEVYHCFEEPHSWHGEGKLTADGIDEDSLDLPVSGAALTELERRIHVYLTAWVQMLAALGSPSEVRS